MTSVFIETMDRQADRHAIVRCENCDLVMATFNLDHRYGRTSSSGGLDADEVKKCYIANMDDDCKCSHCGDLLCNCCVTQRECMDCGLRWCKRHVCEHVSEKFRGNATVLQSNGQCSICLNDILIDDGEEERMSSNELCARVTQTLGCKHTFHLGCINKWLTSHNTCPCCRNVEHTSIVDIF